VTNHPTSLIDFEKPTLDLPADRLAERVDGAEVKLRRLGCRRLMVWRLPASQMDLELFAFTDTEGAQNMLSDQIGRDRSPNMPGDEGWVGANVLYFRQGASFVRVVADGPCPVDELVRIGRTASDAISKGRLVP
jgi:hypothetical protein